MSRHAEDSDEEVYMSDPSDDEEAKSVKDYDYADDHGAQGGYRDASETPAVQAGSDSGEDVAAAMHAAEEERARLAQPPASKQPATAPKGLGDALSGSRLSAAAPPWTPTRTLSSASQDSSTAAHNASHPKNNGQGTHGSASTPEAAGSTVDNNLAAVKNLLEGDKLAQEPSTPEKPAGSSEEFPGGSPIDVRGMLHRAAVEYDSPIPPVKNGAKEAGSGKAITGPDGGEAPKGRPAGESAGESPAGDSSEVTRTASEAPKDIEHLALSQPPASEPISRQEHTSADESPAATEQPASVEEPATISSGSLELPSRSTSEAPKDLEALAEGKAPAEQPPAHGQPEAKTFIENAAGSSSGAEKKEPPRASAMPMLPERKRAGSANPALPPRPNRSKAAQPADAGPSHNARDVAPSTPANEEQPAQQNRASPVASTEGQAGGGGEGERPVPASGERPPPANGQRDAVVVAAPARPANDPTSGNPAAPAAASNESPEHQELRGSLRDVRITLARTALRLGMLGNSLVAQVQYRLNLAERIRLPRGAGSEAEDVVSVARRAEENNSEEEIFGATIMVIGISGVGKSALINSLLGYEAVAVSHYDSGTSRVQEVTAVVHGLQLRLIDTPGLEASADRDRHNRRVLSQIEKARRKYKPDMVLYVDRLDMPRRDLSDVPVLRAITQILGSELWFNCIIVLTHATAEPPLGPNGAPMSYDTFSKARSAQMQRIIQAAVGDARIATPVAFAENHPDCPCNAAGEPVLPDQTVWRKFLLMWLASMKLLSDTDSLLDSNGPARNAPVSQQQRLLQEMMRQHRGQKMPPPAFLVQQMIRHQGPKLYPDEEREILREDEIRAIKNRSTKQKEARKRRDFQKQKQSERRMLALEGGDGGGAAPGVAAPELALSPSFDAESTSHLYHQVESHGGWLTRPKVEPTPVDHTDGVDSFASEKTWVLRKKDQVLDGIPASVTASLQKDKDQFAIQAEAGASLYHSWQLVSTGNVQVLSLGGPDLLYTTTAETQFKGPVFNKATLGGLVSRIGEDGSLPTKGLVATGLKLEDEIALPDIPSINGKSVVTAGIGRAQVKLPGNRRERATGANVEWTLTAGKRESTQVIAGASMMSYRGNKGVQGNLSTSFFATPETQVVSKATLQLRGQQRGQGSFTFRVSSHDHPQMGVALLVPLVSALWERFHRKEEDIDML